ncbi:MAG: SGNH/GDSL hydrolase family protein [bacterium]|nr:SGNH/GDSL hydrolase family protein [bacterium]
MKPFGIYLVLLILFALIFTYINSMNKMSQAKRYFAFGDSYTVGESVKKDQSFPSLLVRKINDSGVRLEKRGELARTGWNSGDLIGEMENSRLEKADLATLLIGANDIVQGVSVGEFEENLRKLIEMIAKYVNQKDKLIVLTIPDFTKTKVGTRFGNDGKTAKEIVAFNSVIEKVSRENGVTVVDIYPISLNMENDLELVATDSLHPSGKLYRKWVDLITPRVLEKINNSND